MVSVVQNLPDWQIVSYVFSGFISFCVSLFLLCAYNPASWKTIMRWRDHTTQVRVFVLLNQLFAQIMQYLRVMQNMAGRQENTRQEDRNLEWLKTSGRKKLFCCWKFRIFEGFKRIMNDNELIRQYDEEYGIMGNDEEVSGMMRKDNEG